MPENHKIILLLYSVLVEGHQEEWEEGRETPGEPSREHQNNQRSRRQVFREKTERTKG